MRGVSGAPDPVTVIVNAGSEVLNVPSLAVMTMFAYVPS